MPPVDDRTPYRSYQKPNAANTLADDVARLRAALDAIDADIAPYTKVSVLCATTANITLSGTQTIDGISASNGARVLVKNQTLPAENGIYIQNNSGAWTRAADMNTAASAANALVGVQSGTANGGSIWINTFKSTDTLGTTAMSWLQVGSTGVTTFSAGTTGLTPSSATAGAVTLAGTLAVANGGTGATTSTGTGSVVLSASPVLTGTSTFRGSSAVRSEAAVGQDAVILAGRAGGTSSFGTTLTPATLTSNRTATLPDVDGEVLLTKVVNYATAADLGASTFSAGVLTGYPYNALASATTTDGSPIVSIDTSAIQSGRAINVASIYVPSGLVVASIDSTTQLTLSSAIRTITLASLSSNGTTATAVFSSAYAPFAVGALITISGTGDPELDGIRQILTCNTTGLTFSSVSVNTFTVGLTAAQTIGSGTANLGFRNVISALSIDSVAMAAGQRVLVKDQRTIGGFSSSVAAATNGIYVVTSAGSTTTNWVLTRATDADTSSNLASARVLVRSGGTENKGEVFYTDFTSSDIINTSAVNWRASILSRQSSAVTPVSGKGIDIDLFGGSVLSSTGVTLLSQNTIGAKTFTSLSPQVHSDAASLYIPGSPIAGNNVTITDSWSFYVGTGNSRFGGPLAVALSGTTPLSPLRGPIVSLGTITPGADYTDGVYSLVPLTGGRGSLAYATITVAGGVVTSVVVSREGNWYQAGDVLSATVVVGGFSNGTGSGFSVPVSTVRQCNLSLHGIAPRIRLALNSTNVVTDTEYGSILFNSGDVTAGGNGDRVRIVGVAQGATGGGALQVWTCPSGSEPKLSAVFSGDGSFRIYNPSGTFYHSFSGSPTANRTVTLPDSNVTLGDAIPAGTVMLFVQTSAPTGWTKDTTSHNNKALRVVTGTASSGGTSAFTTVFASRTPTGTIGATTLTSTQIPSHTHPPSSNFFLMYNVSGGSASLMAGSQLYQSSGATGSTGGGGSHVHSFTGSALDFAVQYVDVIIATKN